jgi:serine protease inhibitor
MVFVLPNKEDGLAELEAKLATTSMDSVLTGLNEVRVEVTIPKFKIEQEINLKDVLNKVSFCGRCFLLPIFYWIISSKFIFMIGYSTGSL